MSERYFLDTNIFVYVFDSTAPDKSALADQLIERAIATRKGVVSFQVIQEFFNVMLRQAAHPMPNQVALEYLHDTFLPLFSVQSSSTLYSEALSLFAAGGLSWYDSLIVAAAQQAKCDVLYSEDLQHGRKFGNLKVVNPFL